MNLEEFNAKCAEISNEELIEKAREEVTKMCNTGGASFKMRVPVSMNDSDVILSELIKRFEALKTK